MRYNILKFSFKVWITGVLIAPLLFCIATLFEPGRDNSSFQQVLSDEFFTYTFFVALEAIISFVAWFIFKEIIRLTLIFSVNASLRNWIIFISGIVLTVITFLVFFPGLARLDDKANCIILMVCNCLCIGLATWYYKLMPMYVES